MSEYRPNMCKLFVATRHPRTCSRIKVHGSTWFHSFLGPRFKMYLWPFSACRCTNLLTLISWLILYVKEFVFRRYFLQTCSRTYLQVLKQSQFTAVPSRGSESSHLHATRLSNCMIRCLICDFCCVRLFFWISCYCFTAMTSPKAQKIAPAHILPLQSALHLAVEIA